MDKGKRHATSSNLDANYIGEINWCKWTEDKDFYRLKQFVKRMRKMKGIEDPIENDEEFLGYGELHMKFMKSYMEDEESIEESFKNQLISKEERDNKIGDICKYFHRWADEIAMRRSKAEKTVGQQRSARVREEDEEWDRKYAEYIVNLAEP